MYCLDFKIWLNICFTYAWQIDTFTSNKLTLNTKCFWLHFWRFFSQTRLDKSRIRTYFKEIPSGVRISRPQRRHRDQCLPGVCVQCGDLWSILDLRGQCFLGRQPPYTLAGFDLTTHSSNLIEASI
jgi:hypothetical protein